MRKTTLTLAMLAAAPGLGDAAEPVYSDPVGFVKLGNTQADGSTIPAVAADTDVYLTIPLETEVAFTGTVDSTTASTITVQGTPGWTANQWVPAPGTGAPYAAIIGLSSGGSGAEEGLRGMIDANDDDTLTVTLTTPGDLTQVQSGQVIRIRPFWTVQSFFANTTLSNDSEVLVFNETSAGINHSSGANYLFFEGDWYDGNFEIANHTVLHPGETFILRSFGAPVPTLAVFGDVPLVGHRLDVSKDGTGAEDMEIGIQNPVPLAVGALNLPAEDDDEILLFNNEAAGLNKSSAENLLYFDGAWYDGDFNDVTTTHILTPGAGFILRRATNSTTLPQEWFKSAPGQ